MSNKNKNSDTRTKKNYIDLLYMSPSEIKAGDIVKVLDNMKELKIELWEELNVLELELSSERSVDFEPLNVNFKDPSDAAFVKNRNIHTIFAITLSEDDLSLVQTYFEKIVEEFGGFLCADSEDFTPVYVGSSIRSE